MKYILLWGVCTFFSFAYGTPAVESETLPKTEPMGTVVSFENNPNYLPPKLFALWNSLTLEEKIGQTIMVYMSSPEMIAENNLGGILAMGPHLADMKLFKRNLGKISSRIKVPLLVSIDQEGGNVSRVGRFDSTWRETPGPQEMRNMPPEHIVPIARDIAITLKETGFNLNLAPAIDPVLTFDGKVSFMERYKRSWGGLSNVFRVEAFIEGMKQGGVACVLKHFPGYDSEQDSDVQVAFSRSSKKRVVENIQMFKDLSNKVHAIMMSSVRYREISDAPAVFEKKIVDMAHEFDEDLVVMTDHLWGTTLLSWISGPELAKSKSYPDTEFKKVLKAAFDAGNDIFLITNSAKAPAMKKYLLELALQDKANLERLERSVARVLKLKYRMGLIP